MFHIYLVGNLTVEQANTCRQACERQFPRTKFDSDVVHGVVGVRIHLPKYEPEGERATKARAFAQEWVERECKATTT